MGRVSRRGLWCGAQMINSSPVVWPGPRPDRARLHLSGPVVTQCSILYYITLYYIIFYYIISYYIVFYYSMLFYILLYYVIFHYIISYYTILHYYVVLY